VLRRQLEAAHRDVEARLDDLPHAPGRPSRAEGRAGLSNPLHRARWTDGGLAGGRPLNLRTVAALLLHDLGARLRDDVLALLEGQAAVLQLDDLGLALGPPFDDAGALDQGVFED